MCFVSALSIALLLAVPPERGFDEIIAGVGEKSREALCAEMQGWVDAHPGDPRAARGLLWMSQLRSMDGREDLVGPLLERVIRDFPESEWRVRAETRLADLHLSRREFGAAIEIYDRLAASASPLGGYLGRLGAARARSEQVRFYVFLTLAAALLLAALSRLWLTRRAGGKILWPIPEEVLIGLPLAAIVLIISSTHPAEEGRAVATIALGGMVLLWVNAVYFRARPPRRGRAVLEGIWGVLQGAALLYCAIVANGLWSRLIDTLITGND
jgi:hypothetical protein